MQVARISFARLLVKLSPRKVLTQLKKRLRGSALCSIAHPTAQGILAVVYRLLVGVGVAAGAAVGCQAGIVDGRLRHQGEMRSPFPAKRVRRARAENLAEKMVVVLLTRAV